MAVEVFNDGIQIGSGSLPIYQFDEWVSNEVVALGEMSANELRTLVFEDLTGLRPGAKCLVVPQNPADFPTLQIRHAWCSDTGTMSVIVKNDSDSPVTYTTSEQFILSFWNTSTPPAP